jgi:hypothetical protein
MKEYFSHDSSARHDEKIIKLEIKFGIAGYAIYFKLLEFMSENCKTFITLDDVDAISYDFHITKRKLKEFLEYSSSSECGILRYTESGYTSPRLNRHIDNMIDKSAKAKASANARWSKANAMQTDSDSNATSVCIEENRIEENRIEENRREENIINKKPKSKIPIEERTKIFNDEVLAYNKEKGNKYPEDMIHDFICYWTEPSVDNKRLRKEDPKEKYFSLPKRLSTWYRNYLKFNIVYPKKIDKEKENEEFIKQL